MFSRSPLLCTYSFKFDKMKDYSYAKSVPRKYWRLSSAKCLVSRVTKAVKAASRGEGGTVGGVAPNYANITIDFSVTFNSDLKIPSQEDCKAGQEENKCTWLASAWRQVSQLSVPSYNAS